MAVDVAQLLSFTVKNNASDLHLSGGVPPMIRVDGDIKRIAIATGETIAEANFGASVLAPVVIEKGTLYVVAGKKLMALEGARER